MIMKFENKEFSEIVRKFRVSTKKFNCDTKLPLYWELIQECMESKDTNAFFIIEQCMKFLDWKIKSLEKEFGITCVGLDYD